MDSGEFDALVAKLEEQARQRPRVYRLKVLLLALLGNAYIGFILAALIALVALLVLAIATLKWVAVKGLVVVVPFIFMVLKTLRVKIEPPEGVAIGPQGAPELFSLIKALRRELRAPRFHRVLITSDFNAAVVQSPRLGVFGWYRNYLLIGLPLLKALSVEQFNAVLAHEFGHLAKGHGRVANWIYRQRVRWSRLLEELKYQKSRGAFLFKPFLEWFSPYFNAFSFPLARANEYVADAVCARATSPAVAAQALTRVEVIGSYLSEKFWPQVHRLADDDPSPRFSPYRALDERMATEIDEASAQRWLNQALARQTSSADTHPALRDRLAALDAEPDWVTPPASATADKLLGSALDLITEHCDDRWQTGVFEHWRQRYNSVQTARSALAGLEDKHARGETLTLQEAYDRALHTETVGHDADAALLQFRALHERAPDSGFINLCLGTRLLWRDDESGLALIERAIELDEDTMCSAYETLRDYHWHHGRQQQAHAYHEKLVARAQLEAAAKAERDTILIKDEFEAHALNADELRVLTEQLRNVEGLDKVYLVRKRVRHLPHKPLYVLGFKVDRGMGLRARHTPDEVLHGLKTKVVFPYPTLLVNLNVNWRFVRKFGRIPAAEVV